MNKYKTFDELKNELGSEFEPWLYKSGIELLEKIDKAVNNISILQEIITQQPSGNDDIWLLNRLDAIKSELKGEDNESK